jgi:rfaE bifunctional protein nucleotidyltransferase chain/domain
MPNQKENAPTNAWEQIYELDNRDDMEWIEEMRKKHLPEISQVSPKIIWVNGCFDVLHAGHIEMLKYARSVGDYLVVGLDTDARVKQSKGESRPINNLENRKRVMEAIRYVDKVVTFGSDDELKVCIHNSGAQAIVVGAEYEGRVIGSDLVEEIILFPRLFDLSTTNIVSK